MPNKKRGADQSAPERREDTGRPEQDDAFPQGREDDDRTRFAAGPAGEDIETEEEFEEDEDEYEDEEEREEE